MSDLRTLHDAFAELERRADAAAAGTAPVVRPRRTARLVPVAATVVAVAGLVAGAVWLAPGDPGTDVAGTPTTSSSTAPTTREPVPTSPDDLVARFRAALGDTATVEVTQEFTVPPPSSPPPSSMNPAPPETGSVGTPRLAEPDTSTGTSVGAIVGGTLTSADVTGSFVLVFRPSDSGPEEWCRLSFTEDCDVSTLPDGSWLATGTTRRAPGAVSYLACFKRPDGTVIALNVGNQEDPRGAAINTPGGEFYGPQPPLTLDRMKAVITSDEW